VHIHDSVLSIGLLGLYKTWHIKRTPYLENGVWKMLLDGETFSREAEGLLVMKESPGTRTARV